MQILGTCSNRADPTREYQAWSAPNAGVLLFPLLYKVVEKILNKGQLYRTLNETKDNDNRIFNLRIGNNTLFTSVGIYIT